MNGFRQVTAALVPLEKGNRALVAVLALALTMVILVPTAEALVPVPTPSAAQMPECDETGYFPIDSTWSLDRAMAGDYQYCFEKQVDRTLQDPAAAGIAYGNEYLDRVQGEVSDKLALLGSLIETVCPGMTCADASGWARFTMSTLSTVAQDYCKEPCPDEVLGTIQALDQYCGNGNCADLAPVLRAVLGDDECFEECSEEEAVQDKIDPVQADFLADDCPEGDVPTSSLFCSGRELSLFAPESADDYDNMFPKANEKCAKSVCQTDNRTLSFYREADVAQSSAISATLYESYDTTDLNVTADSYPVTTGSAETDIIFTQEELGGSTAGVTRCNDPIGGTVRCDQMYVTFDVPLPTQAVACHEVGHAIGLMHGEDAVPPKSNTLASLACMKTPTPSDAKYVGSHNVKLINRTY